MNKVKNLIKGISNIIKKLRIIIKENNTKKYKLKELRVYWINFYE